MRGVGWRLPPVLRQLQCPLVHRQRPDSLGKKAAQPVAPWPFSREAIGDEKRASAPHASRSCPCRARASKTGPCEVEPVNLARFLWSDACESREFD